MLYYNRIEYENHINNDRQQLSKHITVFETELVSEIIFVPVHADLKYHNQMKSTVVFWWRVFNATF